jgi:hypothetical protein
MSGNVERGSAPEQHESEHEHRGGCRDEPERCEAAMLLDGRRRNTPR